MFTEAYGTLSSIPEFGQLALIMAFLVAVLQTLVPSVPGIPWRWRMPGHWRRHRRCFC